MALRNHPRISKQLRKKICGVADQMGYHRDPRICEHLAYLRQKRVYRSREKIALLKGFNKQPGQNYSVGIADFCLTAREHARQCGYDLEEYQMGKDEMNGRRLTEILIARGIRGVILPPTFIVPEQLPDFSLFVSATCDGVLDSPDLQCAGPHYFHNALLSFENLLALGYRKIGFACLGQPSQRAVQSIHGAYNLITTTMPLPAYVPPCIELKNVESSVFLNWYKKYRPEVILATNPTVLLTLEKAGIKVPQDVGIAVLGVSPNSKLAGIDHRYTTIYTAMADLVISQLQRNECGIPEVPQKILIEGKWMDGLSAPAINLNS